MSSTASASPVRLAGAIFAFSVAAALYSLAIFRLLSFFIMPSIFFTLLLVGFPIGAALASRRVRTEIATFRRALLVLQLAMAGTVLLTLLCKHVDYMRAHLLFQVDPMRLLLQILSFSLLYLPFFVAYGAAEYTGYLAGRESFTRRMKLAYALCLFGGAVALGICELLLQHMGIVRLLIASIGLVSLAALLAGARWPMHFGLLTVLALLWVTPGLDARFMALFKSKAPASVADSSRIMGARTIFSGWGRYAYFELMQSPEPMERSYAGFYNDVGQWYFLPESSRVAHFREEALGPFLRHCRSAVVVGAGGGRDVKLARDNGVERIVAIEIEPLVVHVVRHELADAFGHIYDQPGVEVRVADARKELAGSAERFDAVLFWSVGGYAQLMLEPGNMIRTIESLGMFLAHLTERGLFIMGYDETLDPDWVLLRQYYATLTRLGASTFGFRSVQRPRELLLVALSPTATAADRARWEAVRHELPSQVQPIPPEQLAMAGFVPVTDDRPYLAGNIRNVLPPEHVQQLFLALSGALALIGVGTVWYMRSCFRKRTGHRLSLGLLGVSFLVGSNFLLLQHHVVLSVFRLHYVYYDSLIVGVVAFLLLTGLGSLLVRESYQRWVLLVAGVCAVLLFLSSSGPAHAVGLPGGLDAAPGGLSVHRFGWFGQRELTVVLLVALVVASGRFFPTVFEMEPETQLYVFGMDALGAAAAALLAFFVPILAGIASFQRLATTAFLVTSGALIFLQARHWRGHRDL